MIGGGQPPATHAIPSWTPPPGIGWKFTPHGLIHIFVPASTGLKGDLRPVCNRPIKTILNQPPPEPVTPIHACPRCRAFARRGWHSAHKTRHYILHFTPCCSPYRYIRFRACDNPDKPKCLKCVMYLDALEIKH